MGTILVVEDDPDIRYLVSYKLNQGGFDVIEAENGFVALDVALRQTLDMVVLDMRLPRLSGLEVCRELRGSPRTASVPILMLTARTRQQDAEAAYAAGASAYVVKPFSPRELLERVESLLVKVHH
jgi:two-component system, OmpR family, phosphate regulon response regulator PhoB